MDFSGINGIAKQHIVDVWDAFLVYEGDAAVRPSWTLPGHKTVVLDRIPTAENLAAIVFETLAPHYHGHYGAELRLTRAAPVRNAQLLGRLQRLTARAGLIRPALPPAPRLRLSIADPPQIVPIEKIHGDIVHFHLLVS